MYSITVGRKIVENEQKTVYGIMYNGECLIKDVSNDRNEVEQMIALFNAKDLAPYQLSDVLHDIIE